MPKNIFDTQVAFNLVTRYGEQAAPPLGSVELRIAKHFRLIAGAGAPEPSLLLVQAPIFHGHAFAIHLEMEKPVDIQLLSQSLAGDHVNIPGAAEDAPSNVSAAGQNDIQLAVVPDAKQADSVWLWATSDNLRIAASTAVESAETIAATRPRGKIQ